MIILGDLHYGKSDIHDYWLGQFFKKFWEDPRTKDTTIVQLGDVFNDKKGIKTTSFLQMISDIIEPIKDKKVSWIQIVGNHDCFYRNTSDVNSPLVIKKILGEDQKHFIVVSNNLLLSNKYQFLGWGNVNFASARYCFGHFEISGFEYQRGIIAKQGLSQNDFSKYEMVFSGHWHRRQQQNNILYVGSILELDWGEIDYEHGYYILEDNGKLEFVPTNIKIFEKIIYNDDQDMIKVLEKDFNNKIVKLVQYKITDKQKYEAFVGSLKKQNIFELKEIQLEADIRAVIENKSLESISSVIDMAKCYFDDTIVDPNINKDVLVQMFLKLHEEALIE